MASLEDYEAWYCSPCDETMENEDDLCPDCGMGFLESED